MHTKPDFRHADSEVSIDKNAVHKVERRREQIHALPANGRLVCMS